MLRLSCSDHFLSVSVRLSAGPFTLSNDNSSKAIEAICLQFGNNVAWVVCVCVCVWGGGGGGQGVSGVKIAKIAKIMIYL